MAGLGYVWLDAIIGNVNLWRAAQSGEHMATGIAFVDRRNTDRHPIAHQYDHPF